MRRFNLFLYITIFFILSACDLLIVSSCVEPNLPQLLKTQSGTEVVTSEDWQKIRRPEIIELFKTNVYGRSPIDRPQDEHFEIVETDKMAMSGNATRKKVKIRFSGPGGNGNISLLVFIPNNTQLPVPAFVLICHRGQDNIDPSRKIKKDFWPAEEIVSRGYAAITFHVSDLDPDDDDGFNNGVHGVFDGAPPRPKDAWGTIAAWSWGASRVMDYLVTDPDINNKQIAIIGHSRGGKASLWAGALDERFALVISNESGCTGAALARRDVGESVASINKNFPHWFCENYNKFNNNEDDLPVDQHMLIALIAPRLAYVASAEDNFWADPVGEFLSCVYAEPVYALYGEQGLGTQSPPEVNIPIHDGRIGYHMRSGNHDLTKYDWKCYLDYASKQWYYGNHFNNTTTRDTK